MVSYFNAKGEFVTTSFAEFEKFRAREIGALERKVEQARRDAPKRIERMVAAIESPKVLTGLARAIAARQAQLAASSTDKTKRVQ